MTTHTGRVLQPQGVEAEGRGARRMSGGSSGFTLIELLVALAILGIVSAIAVVNLATALDKSRQRQSMATMRNMSTAIEAYSADEGQLPANGTTSAELQVMLSPNVFNNVATADGWGYDITYSSAIDSFTIESFGRDGADGPSDILFSTRDEFDNDLVLSDGTFIFSPESFN